MTAYRWKDGEPTEQTQARIDSGHHDFCTMSRMVTLGYLVPVEPATYPGQVIEAIFDDELAFCPAPLPYITPPTRGRYLSCGTPEPTLWQRFVRWWKEFNW